VLVVPAGAIDRLGAFEGFRADRRYFKALGQASFAERDAAETDESLRQIIPYVVARAGSRVFSYGRTTRGGERRLHGLRSVGLGGHVNPEDLPNGVSALASAPEAGLIAAAQRELTEETVGLDGLDLTWLGFIRESGSAVARVHFGVVFVAELADEWLELSAEGKLGDGRFAAAEELLGQRDQYEGWSQYVIAHLCGRS
jgi:predicted NUDIX family phosphoesterase